MVNENFNRFYSKNYIKYIEYIFIIFTILGNSVFYFMIGSHFNSVFITGSWVLLLLFLFSYSVYFNNHKYDDKLLSLLFIFVFLLIICFTGYYLYHPYSLKYSLSFVIYPIFIIIYFCNSFNGKRFNRSLFYKFENIMTLLAIISLIFYILYCIGLKPNTDVLANWGISTTKFTNYPGYFYLDFFPTTNYNFLGLTLVRNTSIFVEAPTYAYLLSVALFINLFLHRDYNFRINYKCIILSITILSTLSTTGIMLMMIAFMFLFIKYGHYWVKLLLIVLIPFLIYMSKLLINNKMTNNSLDNVDDSYYVRQNNIASSIEAWHKHIIFGNGIGNFKSIIKYINPLRSDKGITSNLFVILAFGGILLLLFYVVPLICSFILPSNVIFFVVLNFLYFIFEGIMLYKIFIIIWAFTISCLLLNSYCTSIKRRRIK